MPSLTLYYRDDTQTVNTVNGYKAQTTNSTTGTGSSPIIAAGGYYPDAYSDRDSTISKIASDGTETVLGTNVAMNTTAANPAAEMDGNWDCPGATFLATDCIKIVERLAYHYGGGHSYAYLTFVTDQLGWTALNASTWTVHRWEWIFLTGPYPTFFTHAGFSWGSSTYPTRITGIDYSVTTISKYMGQPNADLLKVNGQPRADVKKLMGVA